MKKLLYAALAAGLITLSACGHDIPEEPAYSSETETESETEADYSASEDYTTETAKIIDAIPFGVYDTDGNDYTVTSAAEEEPEVVFEPTEDELQEAVDIFIEMMNSNAKALPLSEEYYTVPEGWVDYTFKCGVTFKAPAGLFDISTSDKFELLADNEEKSERNYLVSHFLDNDWIELSSDDEDEDEDEYDEYYQSILKLVMEQLGISYENEEQLQQKPLESLGYKADTRYDLTKSLLTITDEELAAADKSTANAIRLMRGMIFSTYGDEAYIIEKDNAHVFIHQYGDDGRYWVNVMPSENYEYCVLVKAPDAETALHIAASADIA